MGQEHDAGKVPTLDWALEPRAWRLEHGRLHGLATNGTGARFDGTLEQALAQPWASEAQRQPFHDALLQVLATTRTELEEARTRQRGQDLQARLGAGGPARDRRTL